MAEYTRPAEIEAASMRIIGEELEQRGIRLPEETAPVVRRVIHTTADFDYVTNLTFTGDAVRRGVDALLRGTAIVTDTNMAKAGISGSGLNRLGGSVCCLMSDETVAEEARVTGQTRAAVSVRHAAADHPGCIYAVGNAPTALFALAEEIKKGFRPSLIIGVPVGFVNVVEAKEEILAVCREFGVPAIVARGRKGGSNVAAAICNALIYLAADLQDPARRWW